ncbi:MAG: flagellar basal body rod protein FlgB [Spirochaetales bacterium]|nr:flagellar basal body rod protein FlgB [Spirochaetales bacterium]
MFLSGSFGKNMDILKRSMDVSLLRRDVIANNIANAETPNFKRTDVTFESQLKRALDSEKKQSFPNFMTDKRHIAFDAPMDYRDVKANRVLDYLTQSKNNGNNVDVEVEMMSALENQLLYQTMVQVVQSEFSRINIVLKP